MNIIGGCLSAVITMAPQNVYSYTNTIAQPEVYDEPLPSTIRRAPCTLRLEYVLIKDNKFQFELIKFPEQSKDIKRIFSRVHSRLFFSYALDFFFLK